MFDDKVEVRAILAPWSRGVEFLIKSGNSVGIAVTMKTIVEGEAVKPTFELKMNEAQTLMDDLWNCGLRPTEGSGSAGALRATQEHLKDMRKLVFAKLNLIHMDEA
jgi:hypothetical protein